MTLGMSMFQKILKNQIKHMFLVAIGSTIFDFCACLHVFGRGRQEPSHQSVSQVFHADGKP